MKAHSAFEQLELWKIQLKRNEHKNYRANSVLTGFILILITNCAHFLAYTRVYSLYVKLCTVNLERGGGERLWP
jgi:uncharacterized membrane protein YidH (DUF202 family)